jgi:hypothetical protein
MVSPVQIASGMSQDDFQATPLSMRAGARLGQSPRRTRPPVTPNPINVQSWMVGEENGSDESKVKESAYGISVPRQTDTLHSETAVDEDPFRDYLDYESDCDYLSEVGSIPVDEDEPIETIEFGSEHHVSREDLRRKPSVRTVHPAPPDIDTENYPNSPSPFSPTPPTAFPEPPRTSYTDAPSVYSRPSWRASRYPATAAVTSKYAFRIKPFNSQCGQFDDPVSEDNIMHTSQVEQQIMQPRYNNDPTGSTSHASRLRDVEAGTDVASNYGTFYGRSQGLDPVQSVPLPGTTQTVQGWATPVPVTTAQAAQGMPSAQNGSFGADSASLRPPQRPPYPTLHTFWITTGPLVTAATTLVAAILTVLVTRAYGSKVGSVWRVPNRVFSLTAAGDNPGDVRLGLEGWCLENR